MACKEFENRVLTDLLPQFCDRTPRVWGPEGFKKGWNKISDRDAVDFLHALDAGLIKHVGRGLYRAPRSSASEQFFWTGSTKINPRPIFLWVEPIITVAVLARLHFDLGWPAELLGTQSPGWAFDVVAYQNMSVRTEQIACEVKKSSSELNELLLQMGRFGRNPQLGEPGPGKERNAYRKVAAHRLRRAPLFWAVGPDTENQVFKVAYGDGGFVEFLKATTQDISYSLCAAGPSA